MSLIIKNISYLKGRELEFIENGIIEIGSSGIIANLYDNKNSFEHDYTNTKKYNIIDGDGFLLIPGFINAHTHVGDSIGKDVGIKYDFNQKIHPIYGIKKKILENSEIDHIKFFLRNSIFSMLKTGITAFADFREGGLEGTLLLKQVTKDLSIKCIILGRIEYYFDLKKLYKTKKKPRNKKHITSIPSNNNNPINKIPYELHKHILNILKESDGIGISGANENTDESLLQYNKIVKGSYNLSNSSVLKKKKLLAIHAAESSFAVTYSKQNTGKSEIERIVQFLKPDFVIHMTKATNYDLDLISQNKIGIVICPRANSALRVGLPNIKKMLDFRCTVAIGTDNVMLNSPDFTKELDYLWKISQVTDNHTDLLHPREILKMATVNGADLLNLNSGIIEVGRSADILFIDKNNIDLHPIHDVYVSLLNRLTHDCIKGIMINGKYTHGFHIQ